MPLHLNLLHEIETQKAASRRDPLKIAAYILGSIIAIFAALYLWELGKYTATKSNHARLKAEFDKIDPLAREAEKREQDLKQTFETSDKFVKAIEGRFYWAPVLAEVVKIVPREVQITKLGGTVQGDAVKRVQMQIEGIAAGSDPRSVAEGLRQSLLENFGGKYKEVSAAFRQLDESSESVILDGQSLPTAVFTIVLTLQSGEEVAATPPPAEAGRKRRG